MINRYLLTKGRIQDVGMQTHSVALSDHLATNALFALPREFLVATRSFVRNGRRRA